MMLRRDFLKSASLLAAGLSLTPGELWAIGPGSRFDIALLKYEGAFNPRPNGIRKMLQEVEKRTSISVSASPVPVSPSNREELFAHPLLFWVGESDFPPLPQPAIDNLGVYLRTGGTLVIDSTAGKLDSPFEAAARRELRRILPNERLQTIPRSHVLYKSFYLIPDPVGRVAVSKTMDGIFGEERALVLLSRNDLLGAWSRDNLGRYEYDVFPGGERQREMAMRLGINVVMYCLCINYKEDQVHVPFILKRRKWRVD